jgi:iron(III) transport system substrate-binding protein
MTTTRRNGPTRRTAMKTLLGGAALAASGVRPAEADGAAVTTDLVEAAKREGSVVFLNAADVLLAQKIAAAFEAKYPGIKVNADRIGSERIFQRVEQEYGSNIYAVDVIDSADAAHFLTWKERGWLARYVPEDVAKHWSPEERDPDGTFFSFRASLSALGANTKLVKPDDVPKSFADLLDPRWKGKMVKGHPSYSGAVLTTTFILVREFGWPYLEKLAQQRIMQVQSATEPPKKIAQGERAVMVDGSDYVLLDLAEKGAPLVSIQPAEGTPIVPIPTAVMAKAPHPNAARLLQSFLYSIEAQQMLIDVGNAHSFHPLAKEKPGRKPLSEIKLLRADPAEQLKASDEIKRKYTEIFRT